MNRTWWWILIVIWCAMIFYQSGKPAPESQKKSLYIVMVINHWVSSAIGKEVVIVTDRMVRKTAHGIEYFVLGLLLFNGFLSGRGVRKAFLIALAAGISYAVSDEIHQHFVPGRTMKMTDILIDGFGVFSGAGLMVLMMNRRRPAIPAPVTREKAVG